MQSTCHELHAPDPPSGRNGVIIGPTTKKADGTVCGSEPLDLGSIQFATAAPRPHHSRWSSLTRHRSLQEVQAALPLRSASAPAHREPAQFICMPCRFHRPEYSHLTTACHKMPELYWSSYHSVAARPACAPDGALCVCTSLAHEIRGSQPFLLLKLACACQPERRVNSNILSAGECGTCILPHSTKLWMQVGSKT